MARPASPTYLSLRLQRLIPPALFIAPAAVALILTMAAPMAAAVLLSLQHWNGMAPPKWAGFSNYLNLIQDETFLRALWHTAYFTACTVILQTVLPLLIASLLNSGIRGSAVFRTLYFMPVIISLAISGLLWAMLFEPNFGAVNSFLRAIGLGGFTQLWLADPNTVMPSVIIVSVWQSLGFYLVIFFAALQSVPSELYEAAELDGANAWSRFLHVTVPTIRPVILIVIVLNTINGIKVFDQIWVMTAGGPNYASATLGTYLYAIAFGAMGASNSRLGYATAIAIVILLLSIAVSAIQIRLGRRPTSTPRLNCEAPGDDERRAQRYRCTNLAAQSCGLPGPLIFTRTLIYVILVTIVVVEAFPLIWMIITSVKDSHEVFNTLLPAEIKWQNFPRVWFAMNFPVHLGNSLYVTSLTVALVVAVATPAAYAFARYRFPGREIRLLRLHRRDDDPAAGDPHPHVSIPEDAASSQYAHRTGAVLCRRRRRLRRFSDADVLPQPAWRTWRLCAGRRLQ